MTWLKLSDDFGIECERAGLSDAAFRVHVEGLSYVMLKETGGQINRNGIRRAITTPDPAEAIAELVAAGFWTDHGEDCYVITHHMIHQPEPDLLEARRQLTAERVRKHRRKLAGLTADYSRNAVTERVTSNVTNAVTERVTRDGSGRDGTGNLNPRQREEQQHTHNPEQTAWPQVPRCEICDGPLDRKLAGAGYTEHPGCERGP